MHMLAALIPLFASFCLSAIFGNTCIKEASYSSTSRINRITATIIETLNSNGISNSLPKRLYPKEYKSMNFMKTQKYVNWQVKHQRKLVKVKKLPKMIGFILIKNTDGFLFFLFSWFETNSKHILTITHFFKKGNCFI